MKISLSDPVKSAAKVGNLPPPQCLPSSRRPPQPRWEHCLSGRSSCDLFHCTGLGGQQVSGKDEGGVEEGNHTGWVALGCVGDSAPCQPPLVSAGSCTLVAMATPPQNAGRPSNGFAGAQRSLKGRTQAIGEGRG